VTAAHPDPCPACGEPMYGWIKVDSRDQGAVASYVVDRCEDCGLGVTRELTEGAVSDGNGRPPIALADLPRSSDPDATLQSAASVLRAGQSAQLETPNRDSLQAGIGGDQWAAIELPAQRLHLSPRSLDLLLERHGLEATRTRQPPFGRSQVWMWQTLLNGFTFHTNFARDVARRRLTPRAARSLPTFAIDALVSTLAALPIALVSVPLELAAVLARRGGELVVTVAARERQPPGAPLYDRSHGS
jgi:hypothetical protein